MNAFAAAEAPLQDAEALAFAEAEERRAAEKGGRPRLSQEIAELTDTSVNTVASRLRAARKEVRRALERRLADRGRAIA